MNIALVLCFMFYVRQRRNPEGKRMVRLQSPNWFPAIWKSFASQNVWISGLWGWYNHHLLAMNGLCGTKLDIVCVSLALFYGFSMFATQTGKNRLNFTFLNKGTTPYNVLRHFFYLQCFYAQVIIILGVKACWSKHK